LVDKKLAVYFLEVFPRAVANFQRLEQIYKRKTIKLLVLRHDLRESERTLVFSCRLCKIPSLVIQHGILAERNGHDQPVVDKLALWGQACARWFNGLASDRFEITGNPKFDCLFRQGPPLEKEKICKGLGIMLNKDIILFASQQINKYSSFWTDDVFLLTAQKIIEALEHFPDKQLIIKVDPNEPIQPFKELVKDCGVRDIVVVKDLDIHILLDICDLLITLDSTVALEAMIFDKPVITINLTRRQDRVPYAANGAAIGVYKTEDIPGAIESALNDTGLRQQMESARKKFVYEYAYVIDGKAGERVTRLIQKMASNY
jgi:UDP-N-acetylglucosamine 2-epimerase